MHIPDDPLYYDDYLGNSFLDANALATAPRPGAIFHYSGSTPSAVRYKNWKMYLVLY